MLHTLLDQRKIPMISDFGGVDCGSKFGMQDFWALVGI
jgi:hypothetical protein